MPREPFSAMDLLVAGLAAIASAALLASPFVVAPSMAAMYRDFATELPWATELALAWWPSPLSGLALAGLVALALSRGDALHRRALLAASALLGLVLVGALWYALYLPLYQLAGAISAE
jgi:type II secretory pathway component PulF